MKRKKLERKQRVYIMGEWIKPNGKQITVSDDKANVEYVKSLGWVPAKKSGGKGKAKKE